MILAGVTGLLWPLLRIGPNHPEFQAKSLAYRIGAQTSELIISAGYLVAGIGLFGHHPWGRRLSLGFLLIGTIYAANAFAWGFSSGPPAPRVRLFSRDSRSCVERVVVLLDISIGAITNVLDFWGFGA